MLTLWIPYYLSTWFEQSTSCLPSDARHSLVHSLSSCCCALLTTKRTVTPAKAGIYSVSRPVTFAPNVTPVSYVNDESSSNLLNASEESTSLENALYPPSSTPGPPPARKRGKRRSKGHIPRPSNAYILFHADFVKQKYVPGSMNTSHTSLSRIAGSSAYLIASHFTSTHPST